MTPIYNSHRVLSTVIGASATALALWIVLEDAVTSGKWTIDHLLMPVTILTTIVAGHLLIPAWRARRWAAVAGFAILATAGTGLTLYNSVGRVALSTGRAIVAAEDHNALRATARADLKANTDMLAKERTLVAKACRNPDSRDCRGVMTSIRVYEAAVKGNLATLAEIGPDQPVQPKAGYIASILALAGIDEEATARVLGKIDAAVANAFLELTSIVAFGFAFAQVRRPVTVSPPPAARQPQTEIEAPVSLAAVRQERKAAASKAQRLQGLSEDEIAAQDAETLAVIRKAGRPLSNRELAQLLECSEGQASKRWQRVADHLTLGWEGKHRQISAA